MTRAARGATARTRAERGAAELVDASTARFTTTVFLVCTVTAALGTFAVSAFADRTVTDPTGLQDRVARTGPEMVAAWAVVASMAVIVGALAAAALTHRGLRRLQGTCTAAGLFLGGALATAVGVLAARSQRFETTPRTNLLVVAVTLPIVLASIIGSRVVVLRRLSRDSGSP